jgi:hypothetical protein
MNKDREFMSESNERPQIILPRNPDDRKKLISKEATRITREGNISSKSDLDVWLEAERLIDNQIFGQDLQPKEFYGSLMTKFFMEQNSNTASGEEDVAKSFIGFIFKNDHYFRKISEYKNKSRFWNVALLSENASLSFLTKRSLLLSDTTLLGHSNEPNIVYDISYDTGSGKLVYTDTYYLSNCPDLSELGTWLTACQPLLESGEAFYYPKTAEQYHQEDWSPGGELREEIFNTDHIFDALITSRKVVELGELSSHTKNLIHMITEIEIPVIDNVSIENFTKITCDEHESFEIFRDFLRQNFLDLLENEGNEHFEKNLQKIGININSGARKIASDIKQLRRKTAIRSIQAAIGFVVATLVAINSNFASNIAPLLGSAGGLTSFLGIIERHQDEFSKLKGDNFYYIWLLENKT